MPLGGISTQTVRLQSVTIAPGQTLTKTKARREHKWATRRGVRDRVTWRGTRATMVNVQFTRANVNGQLERSFDAWDESKSHACVSIVKAYHGFEKNASNVNILWTANDSDPRLRPSLCWYLACLRNTLKTW